LTVSLRNSGRLAGFSRDAWLEIDLNAIEHNYKQIREVLSPNTAFMAVVKSDAYGHGASTIAPLLQACGVDCFGVASVDEGIQLREAGVNKEILVLSPIPAWSLERAIKHNLQITISSQSELDELEKLSEKISHNKSKGHIENTLKENVAPQKLPSIQIKINTGMNRNGSKWNAAAEGLVERVLKNQEEKQYKLAGIYSHLACNGNNFFTQVQADRFHNVISKFVSANHMEKLGLKHIASSYSFQREDLQLDMVRIGLALYGLGGNLGTKKELDLKPAMSLVARISQIQQIEADEGVGYGLTWKAAEASTIGLLPCGYADGIKRGLSNRIKAIYKNQLISQVGTISMDQISFDFTAYAKEIQVGDLVKLIGNSENQKIAINDWSQILGTVEYEIACDLRARLPRIYVRN
jgi:alanine racemase